MKKKLRVWHIPQVPMNNPFVVDVEDEKTAKLILDVLAAYDQYQFQNNIKPDFANAQGVSQYEESEKEYLDYYNEYDEEFDDFCESEGLDFFEELSKNNNIKFE